MKITENAAIILNICLNQYNKKAIKLKYLKDTKEISMSLMDNVDNFEVVNVDNVNIIFENDADKATKDWTIVEKDGKLSIQRKDKCCCDEYCEYACNKVKCDCE
jgi:hypothetical protein